MGDIIGSCFPARRRLPFLPTPVTFSNGQILTLTYLNEADIEHAYQLVLKAASQGNNVGSDEYDREFFTLMLKCSVALGLTDAQGVLQAVITIAPSPHCWGRHVRLADLRFLFPLDTSGRALPGDVTSVLDPLLPWCETSILDLDSSGYTGCLFNVALPCVEWQKVLEHHGYSKVVHIPEQVYMTPGGLTDNLVFYKELVSAPEKVLNFLVMLFQIMLPESSLLL